MKYHSTRNSKIKINFKDAVLQGIAKDGGLYVPEYFPQVDIKKLSELSYTDLAFNILNMYLNDYTNEQLQNIVNKAYRDKFPENPAPLTKAGDYHYLELYHGRTHAFKDFALSILPLFMEEAIKDKNIKEKILILTSTSGDTGSAALYGFKDLENIDIAVLFPENGVSLIQKLQMTTISSPNTIVIGINGNFDDAQKSVKDIFTNKEILDNIKRKNYILSSANSINIGRLLPQIIYYFHAYNQLLKNKIIELGEKVSFVVPTGNFGDILAGYYAKNMGLPVEKLIVASNENKVLTEFFNSGIYDANRELQITNSPSMDIIISSNLERLLYHKTEDTEIVNNLQNNLSLKKKYEFEDKFDEFYAGFCNQEDTLSEIKNVFEKYKYLIDPHTAVAKNVADEYRLKFRAKETIVILSTASPFKFADIIMDQFEDIERNGFILEDLKIFEEQTNIKVPLDLVDLKNKTIKHKKFINVEDILDTLMEFIGERNES